MPRISDLRGAIAQRPRTGLPSPRRLEPPLLSRTTAFARPIRALAAGDRIPQGRGGPHMGFLDKILGKEKKPVTPARGFEGVKSGAESTLRKEMPPAPAPPPVA